MKLSGLIVVALAVLFSACASHNQPQPAQPANEVPPPAAAAQKPTAAPVAQIPIPELEQQLFQSVNDTRTQHGLHPLARSVGLNKSAREHSDTMANGSFLSTRLAGEPSVLDRMTAAGVNSKMIGENVLRLGAKPDEMVSTAVSTWMANPKDRKNLLSPDFSKAGIAISRGNEGDYYVTQDYAQ